MNFTIQNFSPLESNLFHVAIIPDGGRRWAKNHNMSYLDSYLFSVKKLAGIVDYLYDNNTDIVTVYFSSVYNFKRPINEILSFCEATAAFIIEEALPLANKHEICVSVVGNSDDSIPKLAEAARCIEAATQKYRKKKMFLCVNYSSLQEIADAISKTDNDSFVNHLWVPYPVNCLLRSGDAQVMSDFLLPQCAFARLFFFKKMFNDLGIDDISEVMNQYYNFELKYGE